MYLADLTPAAIEIRNAPVRAVGIEADDFHGLTIALYKHFLKLRGRDPATTTMPTTYPATTNLDVQELASMWTKEVLRVSIDDSTDKAREKLWLDCLANVNTYADVENDPFATYSRNYEFWDCMERIAIWLDVRQLRPDKWDLWWESVDNAVDDLPNTLGSVASAIGGAGKSAASAAGDAAQAVGRGLADFFDEPIKIVAVLIGGAILVPPVIRALTD